MRRVGPFVIFTQGEHERIVASLQVADEQLDAIEETQAEVRGQQKAVIERQQELLTEARRERDLAHARAMEYRGLFVEQQAEIDSLQRQLSVAHHPSTQPRQDES